MEKVRSKLSIITAFLYALNTVLITSYVIWYSESKIYPLYLTDREHHPFWFVEYGISSLVIFLMIVSAIYAVIYFKKILWDVAYCLLDLLYPVVFYTLACPLLANNIFQLGHLCLYMTTVWMALSVIVAIRQFKLLIHLRAWVLGSLPLLVCYFLKPKLMLTEGAVMEYPYIIICLLLIFMGTAVAMEKWTVKLLWYIPVLMFVILSVGYYLA